MSNPVTVYGWHAVRSVLKAARRKPKRLMVSKKRVEEARDLIALARRMGAVIVQEEGVKMDRLVAEGAHQGIILWADPALRMGLDEALKQIQPNKHTLWVALDGLTDPHNLGAIIRSAACLGATAILVPDRRSAPITAASEKAASGALERILFVDAGNLNTAIIRLKEKGFWSYGADPKGKAPETLNLSGPTLLVIGAEGEGLRPKTKEHCDELVGIPQSSGGVESLNASAAAAILLYEFGKQILPKK
jgi:23S rRNA (guanosine2251-2'-O)-methyltransferase